MNGFSKLPRGHAFVVIFLLAILTACSFSQSGLPQPPSFDNLPHDLSASIRYIQPPVNCADANDANVTCSTREGQPTDSDFGLKSQYGLVMTGDGISITVLGKVLVPRPTITSNHDLWVVVNKSSTDIKLHMSAPYGSFRGYFTTDEGWTTDQIAFLRDLHMERFMQPPQPRAYTPTPVQNCGNNNGCPHVNWRIAVWDGTNWTTDSGFYQVPGR